MAAAMLPTVSAAEADSTSFDAKAAPYAVRIGTSIVINAGITEILKASVHSARPDGSGSDSWPSRHASWAFNLMSIAGHELYAKSGWWALGAHAVADAVGMQRTLRGRHYPKDVLGGAMTGLLSTEVGYLLGRLIYPSSYRPLPSAANDFLPAVDVTTEALFPLCGGAPGLHGRTGINTAIRGTMPLAEHWGASVALNVRSMPLFDAENAFRAMMGGAGASAGAVYYAPVGDGRWGFESRAYAGFLCNHVSHGQKASHPSVSFTFDMTGGFSWMVTPGFALGAEGGYHYWALRRAVSSLGVGIFTRVLF